MNPILQFDQQIKKERRKSEVVFPQMTVFDFRVLEQVFKLKKTSATEVCDKLGLKSNDERDNHFIRKILEKYCKFGILNFKEIPFNGAKKREYYFNKEHGLKFRMVKLSGKGLCVSKEKSGIAAMFFDLSSLSNRN